jgi:sec-independent protein translocase protein TatA
MPFSLGPGEMIFIMVVLLLLFGAKRLPELGSGLGKGIREFKRSMNEIRYEIDKPEEEPRIQAPRPAQSVAPPQKAEESVDAAPRNG